MQSPAVPPGCANSPPARRLQGMEATLVARAVAVTKCPELLSVHRCQPSVVDPVSRFRPPVAEKSPILELGCRSAPV